MGGGGGVLYCVVSRYIHDTYHSRMRDNEMINVLCDKGYRISCSIYICLAVTTVMLAFCKL